MEGGHSTRQACMKEKKRKEKKRKDYAFGVHVMRSQVLYRPRTSKHACQCAKNRLCQQAQEVHLRRVRGILRLVL